MGNWRKEEEEEEYLHWFVVVVVVVVDMLLFTLSGDADAVDVREAPALTKRKKKGHFFLIRRFFSFVFFLLGFEIKP